MTPLYMHSIFIFHRDLRIFDNTSLNEAINQSQNVLPIFIYDPYLLSIKPQRENALRFMQDSLKDLSSQLKTKNARLHLFFGKEKDILQTIHNELKFDAVFYNKDYTPYHAKRHAQNMQLSKKLNFEIHTYDDALLNEPGKILSDSQTPLKVFTAFHKKAVNFPVNMPQTQKLENKFLNHKFSFEKEPHLKLPANPDSIPGGRFEALEILKNIHLFKNYEETRNQIWNSEGTTHLSAHNKFGTASIREIYYALAGNLGRHSQLLTELYWRDFFTHIAFFYPEVFHKEFQEKYRKIKWSYDLKLFDRWKNGTTGFPLVDAGMRELNATGYMHNRVRMNVASFLTKYLQIDWRLGERYFAQQLVDYDPCVNNGNWQWAASTGVDAAPYFRIFNPQLQQEKFDPNFEYIKKWIPEYGTEKYPQPIVDPKTAKAKTMEMFKKI